MFKIVLAGDAAVGKSCFIMRLCKGKFVSNLSSTLGKKHFFSKTDITYFRYIHSHVLW
jgi:GTPase SAR1 family protein